MIIQDTCNFSDDLLNYVQGFYFPWYHEPVSSSAKFPFVVHSCIKRGDGGAEPVVNSEIWEEVKNVILDFTSRNGIEVDTFLRCAVNMIHASTGLFSVGDKHVDQQQDHMVFVAYLNDDCTGDTVIYDKKWKEGEPTNIYLEDDDGSIPEKFRKSPKVNTAVCFDGRYYHAGEFPQLGQRRITCVANFTVK